MRRHAELLSCAVALAAFGVAGAAHGQAAGPYATPGGYGASYQALFPPRAVLPPPQAPPPARPTPLDRQPLSPAAPRGAADSSPSPTIAVGVLVSVKDGRVTLRDGKTTLEFALAAGSEIVRDGKPLKLEQLQSGDQLLVQLREGVRRPPVASLVVVVPAAPARTQR